MPELDKDRLAKLLSMTSSEHDAEALAAIRKANELLRSSRKTWFDAVGASVSALDPPRAEAPGYAPRPAGPPPPPPGFQRLRDYRDALRREPFLPRLLGFPFWALIELVALVLPRRYLNTRGSFIAIVFALGMLGGIGFWVWLGYYLVFVV